MKTLVFKLVEGPLHLVVNGADPISDEDWNAYVDAAKAGLTDRIRIEDMRTLVFSDGGTPNPAQRRRISDFLGGRATRVAMVSSSGVVRAVSTAFTWFNPEFKVFSPDRVTDAFAFLGIPDSRFTEVWAEVRKLREELGNSGLKSVGANTTEAPGRRATLR